MSVIRKIISREREGEDIGLDRSGQKRQSIINEDGSYNMEHITGNLFGNFQLYHWLITTNWKNFWLAAVLFYISVNLLFALVYFLIGKESLRGIHAEDALSQFLYCFFFSVQSFTTVGYGGIHPATITSNVVATLEAFAGLMTFAITTGSLYGRFSKPVARIKYSHNALIAPFKNGTAMQFMIANQSNTTLMEMEARVNISWVEDEGGGKTIRRFQQVKLEFDKIAMFPTSWVINHVIDEESVLYGKTISDFEKMDLEIFSLIKGFDDVFSQTIYSRHSYTWHQFVYGAKFRRPFEINTDGKIVMDLTKVGTYDLTEISPIQIAPAV